MADSHSPTAIQPATLAVEGLPTDVRAILEGHWRTASRVHRTMALPFEDFAADVLRLWVRGRDRQDLPADVAAFRDATERLHYDDLFLARRCERGDEAAWEAFTKRYAPDLQSVLRRHTGADEAEQVTAAVLADVALPPKRKLDRTLLGTYEGSGPLWAWLATIGVRRVRQAWRRREAPIEAAGEPEAAVATSPNELDGQATQFLTALQGAWQTLEPREALAVAWKHGDGLSQREVARLLDTSEPTVSRIVQRAVQKIRGHVAAAMPDVSTEGGAAWTRLEAALSSHFEILRSRPHRKTEEP